MRDRRHGEGVLDPKAASHSLQMMPHPPTAKGRFDVPRIKLRSGMGEGDSPAIATRLLQCPFDVDPVGLGPIIGLLGAHRSAQRTDMALPRLALEQQAVLSASALRHRNGRFDALADHLALLLRDRGVDMQSEVIDVLPKQRHEEMHLVFHQFGDQVHVAREAIQPGDYECATQPARLFQCGGKAWAYQKRISARPGLNILMPGDDLEFFAFAKPLDVEALCRKT